MRLLVAVSSFAGAELNGWNCALRETWLADLQSDLPKLFNGWEVQYRLFVGRSIMAMSGDVEILDCQDDYDNLTYKTRGKIGWALERGFDYVFCCFPDTYVQLDRLARCGFSRYDHLGNYNGTHPALDEKPWLCGGPGYFLSRAAMQVLAGAYINDRQEAFEDRWVGYTLWHGGQHLRRYDAHHLFCNEGKSEGGPRRENVMVSTHLSMAFEPGSTDDHGRVVTEKIEGGYEPALMREAHRRWLES